MKSSHRESAKDRHLEEQINQLKEERKELHSPSLIRKAKGSGELAYRFVTSDMWRLHEGESWS